MIYNRGLYLLSSSSIYSLIRLALKNQKEGCLLLLHLLFETNLFAAWTDYDVHLGVYQHQAHFSPTILFETNLFGVGTDYEVP